MTDSVPDFEITIRAAEDDPVNGIIGARGAAGGVPEEHDFAHVRNVIKGQIAQLEGAMPIGWSIEVIAHAETGDQRNFVGNVRRARKVVEMPPDRLEQIKTAMCVSTLPDGAVCGQTIVDQGDGNWVHVQLCAYPDPGDDDEE